MTSTMAQLALFFSHGSFADPGYGLRKRLIKK